MNVRPSAVIIRNQAVLTLRYRYQSTDVYALPGGNPDPGENVRETLVRELSEELGIHIIVDELVACGEVIWNEIKKECLHMVFKAETQEIPVIDPKETTALEVVWIPISDLENHLLYPNIGKQIKKYLEASLPVGYIGAIQQPYIR